MRAFFNIKGEGVKRHIEYAVYKGDNLIVMGAAEQCAAQLKVTAQYIYWMTTQAAQRRLAKRKNPDRCTIAFIVD